MNYTRSVCAIILFILIGNSSTAQFRSVAKPFKFLNDDGDLHQSESSTWLHRQQTQSSYLPPVLSGKAAVPFHPLSSYWLTRMTTQSMNDGKMGTDYFWDHQGNLRESRFFVDVGGKRKPGLKVVFPRR